jgi:hypothetical protein
VTLGDCVKLGDCVTLGNDVKLGDCVTLGKTPSQICGECFGVWQVSGDGQILRSGCIEKPLTWWVENVRRTAEHHDYTPEQIDQYEAYVQMFARLAKIHTKHNPEKK